MQKVNVSHFCSTVYTPLKTRDTIFEFDKKKSFGVHLNMTSGTSQAMHLCWKPMCESADCSTTVFTQYPYNRRLEGSNEHLRKCTLDTILQEAPGYASIAIKWTNKGRTLKKCKRRYVPWHQVAMMCESNGKAKENKMQTATPAFLKLDINTILSLFQKVFHVHVGQPSYYV